MRFPLRTAGPLTILILLLTLTRSSLAAWPINGRALCIAPFSQISPVIVSDGAGGAIVVWNDNRVAVFDSTDIYAQHVLASGEVDPAWPANGCAICTAPRASEQPRILADGAGGAIISWMDRRSDISGDIYAHHVQASGVVDPAWPVNGRAICTAANGQYADLIVSDGAGGAIVAWKDDRVCCNSDLYAQHLLSSGVVDPAWPTNGRAICTATGDQAGTGIAVDGAGGAIITWFDYRLSGSNPDIYAQHLLASGAVDPAWPANGRALCLAANAQYDPTIVADGAGGAIVTWYDFRSGTTYDIYAQRVLASGAVDPAWPSDGRALCTAANSQQVARIVADGAGGAVVTWQDARGTNNDIYAQHVLASGSVDPAWPADGRALCIAASDQMEPTILADGAGGAIVTWHDLRSGSTNDIYAQHVLSSGAVDPAWPTNGSALCNAANSQLYPTIVGDGAGGAIVTWQDGRNGTTDIYALKLPASGVTSVAGGAAVAEVTFESPRPNPASGAVTLDFALSRAAGVTLAIYDAGGRRVRKLISETRPAGSHSIRWDLRNEARRLASAGVYFAQLEVEGRVMVRKITKLN